MKIMTNEMPRSYWRAVAKRNGIAYRTYWMRLQRGWSPKDAATTPLRHAGTRQPDPTSKTQKARAAGIRRNAINEYRHAHPDARLSDDEIIVLLKARKSAPTLASQARAAGLHPDTVKDRLHRGWSLERALSEPPMTRRQAGQIRAKQMWGGAA